MGTARWRPVLYDSKEHFPFRRCYVGMFIFVRISQTLYSLLTSITMEIWLLPHYSLLVNHEVDAARWRPTHKPILSQRTSPYQWTQFCWSVVFLIDMHHHLKIWSFLEWFVYKYWKSESWLRPFPTVAYSGLEEWDAKYIKSRMCTFLWQHLFYSRCSLCNSEKWL